MRTTRVLLGWIAILIAVGFVPGCATAPVPTTGGTPSHPFPRWVAALDRGTTALEDVQARFGDPLSVEQSESVGLVWRYATEEVHWPADDPDRPALAASGPPRPHEPGRGDAFVRALSDFGHALEDLFVYPARRRPVEGFRELPSTIHELELVFDAEGVLERFRYAPRRGVARIPTRY